MRPVFVYGALLLVSLVLAWVQWTGEPQVDRGEKVVALAGEREGLERIEWTRDDGSLTRLLPRTDEHGAYLWIETVTVETRRSKPPKVEGSDGGAPAEPLPTVEEKVEKKAAFKASTKGDEVLAAWSPFLALRKLSAVEPAKLAEIGLDAPKETIRVTRRGKETVFQVGGEAYGTKNRYLRNEATGEVFLVEENIVKDLQHARTRLADRSLWSLETPKIERVVVSDGSRSLELVQKNPDDAEKAYWARAGAESKDEQVQTWMDRLLKLRGVSYVDPQGEEAPKELVARLNLSLQPAGKGKAETLELLEDTSSGEFYARGSHVRGLLKMLKVPTRTAVEEAGPLFK